MQLSWYGPCPALRDARPRSPGLGRAPSTVPFHASPPTGEKLRKLLQLKDATTQQAVHAARQSNPRWNPLSAAARLPEGWAEFVGLHWACIASLQAGQRLDAYDKIVAALQPFIKAREAGVWGPIPGSMRGCCRCCCVARGVLAGAPGPLAAQSSPGPLPPRPSAGFSGGDGGLRRVRHAQCGAQPEERGRGRGRRAQVRGQARDEAGRLR